MYFPGKEMLVADALSHYAPPDGPEIPNDVAINHVDITPQKRTKFKAAICDDLLLHSLMDTIPAGWPRDINDVSHPLHPYNAHYDVLTVEDGLILHGKTLVIPPTDREKVFQAIHKDHLGITRYHSHAR